MSDIRIGRVFGFAAGLALLTSGLVIVLSGRVQAPSCKTSGMDLRAGAEVYQERAAATQKLLVEEKLDLGRP